MSLETGDLLLTSQTSRPIPERRPMGAKANVRMIQKSTFCSTKTLQFKAVTTPFCFPFYYTNTI